ncbi:MAG: hypothetical protein WC455_09180 [Dehalococcoidia bacterium]|jgi:hypothetical protein
MSKVTHYKVWLHIEGLDKNGDCIEGDDFHEPREVARTRTREKAEVIVDAILTVAGK